MPRHLTELELSKKYSYPEITRFASIHKLCYEDAADLLFPVTEGEYEGEEEIGLTTLPLFFVEGGLAVNFVLTGFSEREDHSCVSEWRCIYVTQRFSTTGKDEV